MELEIGCLCREVKEAGADLDEVQTGLMTALFRSIRYDLMR